MPAFKNLNNDSGLKELNDFLASRSYIQGYSVSGEDFAVYNQLPHNVDGDKFPHVLRFYKHIRAQPEHVATCHGGESKHAPSASPKAKAASPKAKPASPKSSPKGKAASPKGKAASPKASPKAEAQKDDAVDDFDLFGGDDDAEAKKQLEEMKKKKEDADKAKKEKPKPVAKSSLVLDVKPEGLETDMAELEANVRKIEQEGLHWGASQLVPVAYGVKKLRIMCTVVDDLVSVDDLQEEIEKIEGCQSTDIFAFNKI